jgi:Uncharacterized protein conserved in bacteria
MQSEEQRLIDGLFSRLKNAEAQSAPRDANAEGVIAQHIQAQPAAPYYMAQTILIQEAAIKQLNEQIQTLNQQVAELQSSKQSSGGFLAGLFGGTQTASRVNDPIPGAQNYGRPGVAPQAGYAAPQSQNYAPGRSGGGFMAGALQTAAGVAGGVVLGNMLMNMFSGTHPQEIVNIIEEPPVPDANDFSQAADSQFLPDDGSSDYANNLNDDSWNNDDFSNDDFGSDDDSWV